MPTFLFPAYRVTFDQTRSDDDNIVALDRVTLSVTYPAGVDTISYRVEGFFEFLPTVDFEPNAIALSDDDFNLTAQLDDDDFYSNFGQSQWSFGGQSGLTYLLDLLWEPDGQFGYDWFVALAGDPLPDFASSQQALSWFESNQAGFGEAGGDFGPGEPISLRDAPGVRVEGDAPPPPINETGTEGADELTGGAGNDTLRGGDGDDTLDGGDGSDTLDGGDGDDVIRGGATDADLRDVVFAGAGDDDVDGGYGNDELYGQGGNDTLAGGFGVDTVQGQDGDDVMTGSAFSDLVFGGAGDDFVNGGFGSDRINGGSGADRFFHVGVEGHGSDWIQDYTADEGDVLFFGISGAEASDFQVNFNHTENAEGERAGDDDVEEAFVIYRPTGQIMWALVDGGGQASISLQISGDPNVYDLVGP